MSLLLLFLSLVLHFFISLADLGFQSTDFLHLIACHSDCCPHIACLFEYLIIKFLALLDEFLLSIVGCLECLVDLLILLLELLQVLIANDLLKELFELPLNVFKALWVKTQSIDFLS